MPENVYLIGAEEVLRAGQSMERAADVIARAASSMEATSHQLIQRAEDLLARVEQLAQRSEEWLAIAIAELPEEPEEPEPIAHLVGARVRTIDFQAGVQCHLRTGTIMETTDAEFGIGVRWDDAQDRIGWEAADREGEDWERIVTQRNEEDGS
jgi:hypothetical protein